MKTLTAEKGRSFETRAVVESLEEAPLRGIGNEVKAIEGSNEARLTSLQDGPSGLRLLRFRA